jgi:quercetin dioxygenase-like cupin family protein
MSSSLPFLPELARSELLSSLVQFADDGIVSKTVFTSGGLRIVLFGLAKGQELTEHSSARRAFVQVLSGSCLFMYTGVWQRLEAGALLHLPPLAPHAVKADQGPCALLLTLHADPESTNEGASTHKAPEANA